MLASARQRGNNKAFAAMPACADAPAMFNLLTGPQLLERVEAALPEHRERLYPPTETLSMFVAQVLSADGSCQQAVDAAMVKRLIAGLGTGSTAHGRLLQGACAPARGDDFHPGAGVRRHRCQRRARWWLWRGRRVVLVDGATVTLSDTEDNQAVYPQPSSQKAGRFPLARLVALVCLGSGVVRDVAVGPFGKGSDELTLCATSRRCKRATSCSESRSTRPTSCSRKLVGTSMGGGIQTDVVVRTVTLLA